MTNIAQVARLVYFYGYPRRIYAFTGPIKDNEIADAGSRQGLRKLIMAQRIYIASDQLLVSHLFTLLERAGISALMQKAVVDVPQEESGPLAWYSELWIMQDGQLAKAGHLLEQALAGEMPGEVMPEFAGWPHHAVAHSSSSPPPAEVA